MLAHFPRYVRKHLMLALFQLDSKHSVRQSLQHLCHNFYRFFLRHILSEWIYDAADKLRIIARRVKLCQPVATVEFWPRIYADERRSAFIRKKSAAKLLLVLMASRMKRGSKLPDRPP